MTIESIYKEMNEIDHILKRSGMYVGSIKEELQTFYIYDSEENKMSIKELKYIPAMLKIVDEVISNSCDEYRRKTNMGLTDLYVTVDKSGKIIVKDNGGIPIVMHKDAKCYVPEFVFGKLRTSSNYNDDEDRNVIGTNGVGSALSNVFSKKFIIDCADKKNSYHRSWENNMRNLNNDLEIKKTKDHYTQTTMYIDFDKFNIDTNELDKDFIYIVEKRCIDAAAANIGLNVHFKYTENNKTILESNWNFKTFEDYINLYSDFIDTSDVIKYSDSLKEIWIFPENNINIGFVNGAECSKGTHFKGVRQFINSKISEIIKKKNKLDISNKSIDSKYSMFGIFQVTNPSYSSQTKEELTTPIEKFSNDPKYKFEVSEDFLNKVSKSDIINIVLDWYKQKTDAEDAAKIRKLNRESKKLLRNDKFINCNSKKYKEKELWIFEGDSAQSGFRSARNPMTQAGYIMRGVPLNVCNMTPTQIMKNQVFSDIVTILGLQWGQTNDPSKLNFGKIVICSDMDYDGHKIASLLLVFFNFFPELFEAGIICRSISPIIIATKGKDIKKFYTLDEYKEAEPKLKNYNIKYAKGLGGLNNQEYKEMMREPIFKVFEKDNNSEILLKKWFTKGIASERKNMLHDEVEA